MTGSAIRASHRDGDPRVQDPYCLRCQPQVMGAALDLLRQAATTLDIEANGVTDNPLIFPGAGPFGDEALSRSEEHTSELQSLMRISYAVFCLKKKNTRPHPATLMEHNRTLHEYNNTHLTKNAT